jgi:hypothetical protein
VTAEGFGAVVRGGSAGTTFGGRLRLVGREAFLAFR